MHNRVLEVVSISSIKYDRVRKEWFKNDSGEVVL